MLKFSTHQELYENEGLKKKSAKSGISYGTLKKVYNRGMAAWKTGHRPGTTPQQWAMARVNSYIGKGKGTYYGADSDLSGKGKKSKKESVGEARVTSTAFRAKTSMVNPMDKKNISDMAKDKKYKGNTSALIRDVKKKYPDQHRSDIVKNIYKKHAETNEALDKKDTSTVKKVIDGLKGAVKAHSGQVKTLTKDIKDDVQVKEISKNLARRYVNKAAIDLYHKGHSQGTADTIDRAGGKHPDQKYKGGPEFKGARRVGGIQRATRKLMNKEADDYHYATGERIKKKPVKKEAMSDAEKAAHQKAIDAFKMKGGKVKKLPPGYADGYHGKADPGAGIKGMISKDDTKDFGTKKKVRSMK